MQHTKISAVLISLFCVGCAVDDTTHVDVDDTWKTNSVSDSGTFDTTSTNTFVDETTDTNEVTDTFADTHSDTFSTEDTGSGTGSDNVGSYANARVYSDNVLIGLLDRTVDADGFRIFDPDNELVFNINYHTGIVYGAAPYSDRTLYYTRLQCNGQWYAPQWELHYNGVCTEIMHNVVFVEGGDTFGNTVGAMLMVKSSGFNIKVLSRLENGVCTDQSMNACAARYEVTTEIPLQFELPIEVRYD